MTDTLIIIDLQEGPFGGGPAKHDAAGLVGRLNTLASAVRKSGGTVIYVQHDGPSGSDHHPDHPGWQLLPALDVQPTDAFVRKTSCDSFLDTPLDAILEARGAKRLIITGWATDYCVDTTVRSALARGYATTVPSDGHTVANRPHLTAEKIIEHHNAIWADFLAPAGPAHVCPCGEIRLST
jgi:nicotinamidase-related amidase